MNLNAPHTKAFLDAVDLVLNSNTFLLELETAFADPGKVAGDVSRFIRSGEFKKQILEQDLARDWQNYQFSGAVVTGDLFKPDFSIKTRELSNPDAVDFLRNMLTIEVKGVGFESPYNHQLQHEKAQQLTVNFLDELMQSMHWKAVRLNTDFSVARRETNNKHEMTYFEGDFGSDSATLLIREDDTTFLLLTNGVD